MLHNFLAWAFPQECQRRAEEIRGRYIVQRLVIEALFVRRRFFWQALVAAEVSHESFLLLWAIHKLAYLLHR